MNRKDRRLILAACGLIVFISSLAPANARSKKPKDPSLELQFVPQEATDAPNPDLTAATIGTPLRIELEDAREIDDPAVVGDGTNDDDELFAWRTTSDVHTFVSAASRRTLSEWGLTLDDQAKRVLRLRMVRFAVSERNLPFGSTYAAETRFVFEAIEDGAVVAQGVGFGEARRYGEELSGANVSEVLSDSLKEALAQVARKLDEAATPTTPPPPTTPSLTSDALLEEVLKLRTAGVGDGVLIQFLESKRLAGPMTADEILRWKETGLSEDVITAAMKRAP